MAASRVPRSSQTGPHRRLDEIVRRHLASSWRQPIRAYNQTAFAGLSGLGERDVIVDAGCGTARSTRALALRFPHCAVIGVDRSLARLDRAPGLPQNAWIVRADLADFWRLAFSEGWRLYRHFLLYPNPWPKS
ncbi:MAG: tRNA (guanine-N(7)-)-methyltransferase, partial [Xanthomonadaceae bacterium]|nr:tRNA (guanine-N(7)-)-methyltransferase [Xanthomonadaceae bacterium]